METNEKFAESIMKTSFLAQKGLLAFNYSDIWDLMAIISYAEQLKTDIFMCNLDEGMTITARTNPKDIADFFLVRDVKAVVVKLGSKGCYLRTKDFSEYIPTHMVNAVDTTGAGDCFCAGYLAGINFGWDIIQSARFGNACGSTCTTAIGATTGISNFEATIDFMKNTPLRIGQDNG